MLLGAVLAPLCLSWVDQALAVAGQIAMDRLGPSYSVPLAAVFAAAGDSFARPAQAAAWTRYAGRAPFHIASFDHWHFHPTPYAPTGAATASHAQDDSLHSAVYGSGSVLYALRTGAFARAWPFAWGAKIVMGGIADSLAPLHGTELFSADFPDGDASGRRFAVALRGRATTLFAAWESGCGAFADNLSFAAADWDAVDALARALAAEWPHPAANYSAPTALAEARRFDQRVVYAGAAPGQPLTDAYVANCSAEVRRRVAHAGYALTDYFSLFAIPAFADAGRAARAGAAGARAARTAPGARRARAEGGAPRVRASEIASWALMGALAPALAFLVWKRHFGMR
jgi:hypothetical protein